MKFHLLPNAHLDPVWLWDWREGMNEGLITVRSILDLMDEFPDLTFIRGESSIYRHIEENDPAAFDRIRLRVGEGRWDVVGGTYNQPDTNLAATETLCRQYETGLAYFRSRFGITPKIAWQADSFGHTPGLPNILRAFGMEGFMFTRPGRGDFPMATPAFLWECGHDDRILCYRQYHHAYCSERHNLPAVLDLTLKEALTMPLRNVAVLMGLGNHGGGPSRRHLQDTLAWAALHPEVEVAFSTFHRFFADLRKELSMGKFRTPSLKGDMGFCLRGCYSSVAKFKSAYRRAEALLGCAESTQSLVRSQIPYPAQPLTEAWEAILFNSFHDILPGTSIERAFDDQLAWVGQCHHEAQKALFEALNRLAACIDTRVPPPPGPDRPTDVPLLVWNPLPRPRLTWIELEACLDYRPDFNVPASVGSQPLHLEGPGGEKPAFQEIPTEHHSMRDGSWRKRVVFQTELPPMGWKVFRLGLDTDPARPATFPKNGGCRALPGKNPSIENKAWKVRITASGKLKILNRGRPFFNGDGTMSVGIFEDIWGSWGGTPKKNDSRRLEKPLEIWTVSESALLQDGPEQAVLWTRWQGKNSWLDLTFTLRRDAREILVSGRALWNERSARLKLIFPSQGPLVMEVPAAHVRRNQPGNLPCGRWFQRGSNRNGIAFASDVLGDVDTAPGRIHVTIARASRYADDVATPAQKERWRPATDCGELRFQFSLARPGSNPFPVHLAEDLIHPPVSLCVPAHPGCRGPTGSLAEIQPNHVTLLSARTTGDGRLHVRIQNQSGKTSEAVLILSGRALPLGPLKAWQIKTLALKQTTT